MKRLRWGGGCLWLGLAWMAAGEARGADGALRFDGTNDYVTFGPTNALGATNFTVECWFVLEGTGTTVTTGTGGVPDTLPLVTKGCQQVDQTNNLDANYVLGLTLSNLTVLGDFEEGAGGASPSLNHPVRGTNTVISNVWNHAAIAYNRTNFLVYLNGVLENTVAVTSPPRFDSIQHAALAACINSTGFAQGFFSGVIDEPRVWNYARSASEIRTNMQKEITSAPGLLGRWALDEGAGVTVSNTANPVVSGSLSNGPTWAPGYPFAHVGKGGLYFDGENDRVNFGPTSALGLASFTIETWIKKLGPGRVTTTGAGGITNGIPLVSKGRGGVGSGTNDVNYFLGLRQSDGVLVADFEEGAAGAAPGLNHPIIGNTPVTEDIWFHAAVTYDGTNWNLYLNGALDATELVSEPVRSDSVLHAGLGSAFDAAGNPAGFFHGLMDEVRIWNYPRTSNQIFTARDTQIAAAPGLVGRWSLDETNGLVAANSATPAVSGALQYGPVWATGSIFAATLPPLASLTNPLAASVFTSPASFLMQAAASDDGIVTGVSFLVNGSEAGVDATAPYSLLVTGLTIGAYTLRAAAYDDDNLIGYSSMITVQVTSASGNGGLYFDGVNDYVTFGPTNALGASNFTIETWFKRTGPGVGNGTGNFGVTGLPMVAKGRNQVDGNTNDMNYVFGLSTNGQLVADFEDMATGLNHRVFGVTEVSTNVWYHGAVTYDGTNWRLYLNGILETTQAEGATPRFDSAQHASLGSSLTSDGTPAGFFNGVLDEVRIWNYARTQGEISSNLNGEIIAQPGLIARWDLNEIAGPTATNRGSSGVHGSLVNGPIWTDGAPFSINRPPSTPGIVAPANGATNVSTNATLTVSVSDPDTNLLTVVYYGRAVAPGVAGEDFTLIALPDTQYYSANLNGGNVTHFIAQTEWILTNRIARNIRFVTQLGDCTEHGSTTNESEWKNATSALYRIESPGATSLADGLPYGVAVGNHDQSPIGDADGSTGFYNQYFGTNHFAGKSYYAGHYGTNNDNHVELFSASGLNFVIVHLEYDTTPDAAVLDWANGVLQTYSNRRAIVVSHHIIGLGNPGAFSTQGQAIYNSLRTNDNLFLLLAGHVPGEGRRQDTFGGRVVDTLMSDYQGRVNGGDGWLRIMEFSPSNNLIRVKTYSPTLGTFETDADSEFTVPYNMSTGAAFAALATNTGVASGSNNSMPWNNRAANTPYEWYATVSDGTYTVFSVTSSFTTGSGGCTDCDGDGLPDAWEVLYFGHATNGASGDADGDGVPNRDEYVGGTLPTNGSSYFRVTAEASAGATNSVITVPTVPVKKYAIYFSDANFSNGLPWTAFANTNNGVGTWVETSLVNTIHQFVDDQGTNTTLGPPAAARRFYRVTVGDP